MAAEGAILTLALACAAHKLRSSSSALLPSDDGLPIGMFTSLLSAECSSRANHVHVRALCRHFCLLHLLGLESFFLHKNHPFVKYSGRLGISPLSFNSSTAGVTRTPSWYDNQQPFDP
jgi:hypothetical protein